MAKKISDEIRKWCDFYCNRPIYNSNVTKLRDLAYRIDSEMVELPRSADGKIWTSHEVCFWIDSGDEFKYHRFGRLVRQDGKWFAEDSDGIRYEPKFAWLKHPDSLERIIDDIKTFGNEADINNATVEFLCKIQERIYWLAKKEEVQ